MRTVGEPQSPATRRRLGSEDLLRIAQESDNLLRSNGIQFLRGEPVTYCHHFARVSDSMTLPIVAPARRRDAVFLKVLYGIWNFVVDDEIDRDRMSAALDASLTFLMAPPLQPTLCSDRVCRILDRMAEIVPTGRISRSDPVGFDLWEVAHGLCYELLINQHPTRATPFEYLRYSTMTASIKIYLDIDCLWAEPPLNVQTYRTFRKAYDELSAAIKLASDVGTLNREVHEEDNLNYLRVLAGENGGSENDSAEAVMAEALRFREETLRLSRMHLATAGQSFATVPEVDAGSVIDTATQIVETYASDVDPFFWKATNDSCDPLSGDVAESGLSLRG